jgi:hypothetical protein
MKLTGEVRNGVGLTPIEAKVFDALTDIPEGPGTIAERAGLTNMHKAEAGARYCIALVKKGLAERTINRGVRTWARKGIAEQESDRGNS